jgi:hypothetical protein
MTRKVCKTAKNAHRKHGYFTEVPVYCFTVSVCNLFNDTFSVTQDYIALNEWIISE